jgi:hypothetical protein
MVLDFSIGDMRVEEPSLGFLAPVWRLPNVTTPSGAVVPRVGPGLARVLEALMAAADTGSIDSDEGRDLCLREGERPNFENRLFEVPELLGGLNSAITSALAIFLGRDT